MTPATPTTCVLIEREMGPTHWYLLTVRGRKTGQEYSAPVTLVERDGKRYLVAPYREINWVWNPPAAGIVTLTRGTPEKTALCCIEPVNSTLGKVLWRGICNALFPKNPLWGTAWSMLWFAVWQEQMIPEP